VVRLDDVTVEELLADVVCVIVMRDLVVVKVIVAVLLILVLLILVLLMVLRSTMVSVVPPMREASAL